VGNDNLRDIGAAGALPQQASDRHGHEVSPETGATVTPHHWYWIADTPIEITKNRADA
jgi:hypothetical protein